MAYVNAVNLEQKTQSLFPLLLLNMADETKKRPIQFIATWNNSKYPLQVPEDETVATLKETLAALTNVPPKRQKLLGFVKGKLPVSKPYLALPVDV